MGTKGNPVGFFTKGLAFGFLQPQLKRYAAWRVRRRVNFFMYDMVAAKICHEAGRGNYWPIDFFAYLLSSLGE